MSAVQLYSTRSYGERDLRNLDLVQGQLSGWRLHGQNLEGAKLDRATLTNADLSDARLTSASLERADATGAHFQGADARGADFLSARLAEADFSQADLRGAVGFSPRSSTKTDNAILPDGRITGLNLARGERLVVHDANLGVLVENSFSLADGALAAEITDATWNSTIAVAPGVVPHLGGAFQLTVGPGGDLGSLVGTAFHIFSWQGALGSADRFEQVTLPAGTLWDLADLYVGGTAKLLAFHSLSGDIDGDSRVDLADFGVLKVHFGQPGDLLAGDLTGDGAVDLNDFGVLKANFGKSGAVAVPEPASVLLALLAFVSLTFRKRRSRR